MIPGLFYNIFVGCIVTAFVLALTFLVLTFVWNLPKLFSEVSGKTSARRIKKLKDLNTRGAANYSTSDIFHLNITDGETLDDELDEALGPDNEEGIKEKFSSLLSRPGDTKPAVWPTGSDKSQDQVVQEHESPYSATPSILPGFEDSATASQEERTGVSQVLLAPAPEGVPEVGHDPGVFDEDSSTGVFEETDPGTEDWDGYVFSQCRSVIVLHSKTSLNR